jgi:hypothetical protein
VSGKLKKKVLSRLQKRAASPDARAGVASWLQTTSAAVSPAASAQGSPHAHMDTLDPDAPAGASAWRAQIADDWDAAIDAARRVLVGAGSRARLEFLQDELLPLAKRAGASLQPACMPLVTLLTRVCV